jgi:class 3 adenylate cyclase
MFPAFVKTKEPMRKDASCINIITCESYIKKSLSYVPYHQLFDSILGNGDFLVIDEDSGSLMPVHQDYLLESSNWISNKLLGRVYKNTVQILNDHNAVYKAGRNIHKSIVNAQIFFMRIAGVRSIINRLPTENAKFNRNRTVDIIENNNGYAIVRFDWNEDPCITKHFCDMNRGVYEGLGRLTNNPATVEEMRCQFDGDDYCEYHITWKAKPFFSRIMDLIRFWLSHEIIDELERKIEEVNAIRLKQEKIIKLRTHDLEKEKEKVVNAHNILSRYVAPQLVRKIIEGEVEPVWGHTRKKLTIFFSDIEDFTQTTDRMEPEDMANLLNEYFSNMNEIIQRYEGTLASIIGDGLYVFFGAPDQTNEKDQAFRCVKMAIDMQKRMTDLQQKWFQEGIENPLRIRCGINTGMATVGGFGSEERREYTAMGMQVNLAARLEAACKPGEILISHSTLALVKDRIKCEAKGQIEVKGFSRPIRVYSVEFRSKEEETP